MPNATVRLDAARYIYRCTHLTMEGDCPVDHGPRAVSVGPLVVDVFPVTNDDFKEFLAQSRYQPDRPGSFLRHWTGGAPAKGAGNHPVVWVSPKDAEAYATWKGGRLPTDEEWQFIAAGPEHRRWPWGDRFDASLCNHEQGETMPVDAHPGDESWCGCRDLCGNVWEWTQPTRSDRYHEFALMRGGSWYRGHDRWHVQGGARRTDFHWKLQLMNDEINRSAVVGFRCVFEVK